MGNRALIVMQTPSEKQPLVPAIYVHWNGGIDSVEAICDICRERKYRDPASDPSYAMARMVGVWHEFFGVTNGISLGVMQYDGEADQGDNGVYVLGADWKVIRHFCHSAPTIELEHECQTAEQKRWRDEIKAFMRKQVDKIVSHQ